MCSSFTWGTVSVHYLLRLPLEYAFRSATPNGLMLLLKLTYSRAMLSPIDSLYLPWCSSFSSFGCSSLCMCVFFLPFTTHCPTLFSVSCVTCCRQYIPHLTHIPRAPFAASMNRICVQYVYRPLVLPAVFGCTI